MDRNPSFKPSWRTWRKCLFYDHFRRFIAKPPKNRNKQHCFNRISPFLSFWRLWQIIGFPCAMLRWPQHFSGQEGLGKMSKDRGCETIFVSLQLGTLEWFCWTHTNWMYDHSWDPRPFVKKAVTAWHGEIFHSWLQYTSPCCKGCCLPFWPIHYSPPSKSFSVCMFPCSYLKNNLYTNLDAYTVYNVRTWFVQ